MKWEIERGIFKVARKIKMKAWRETMQTLEGKQQEI